MCSKIIHLIHNNNVKSQVTKVLNECELRMYESVAFPAIGTGLHFLGKAMRAVVGVVQKLGQSYCNTSDMDKSRLVREIP